MGGGRAALRVVRHRPAECAAGPVDLLGGGVPAARAGGDARGGRRLLRLRAAPSRSAHTLLHPLAVVRRIADAHDQRAGPGGVRALRRRRRAAQDPHGDSVLVRELTITARGAALYVFTVQYYLY